MDYPTVQVNVDREKAGLAGLMPVDVARALVTATSSSRFVVPNYWADPKTGIAYQVQVEVPRAVVRSPYGIETVNSIDALGKIPLKRNGDGQVFIRDVAALERGSMPGQYDRYNMKRQITLTANVVGSDLGSVATEIKQAIARAGKPPTGSVVETRGQIPPMQEMQSGLSIGLLLAVVAVFLLLTANYQSIKLALVTTSTIPAVMAGVILSLWITGSTINIQSFIGAIMAVGVAMANSILLVTFAEKRRRELHDARLAAIDGASSRLRAILMTSLAMMAGMLPMALASAKLVNRTRHSDEPCWVASWLRPSPRFLSCHPSSHWYNSARNTPVHRWIRPTPTAATLFARHLDICPSILSDPHAMTSYRLHLLFAIALLHQCGCQKSEPVQEAATPTAAAIDRVTAGPPVRKTLKLISEQPGRVLPFEQTPMFSKLAGYVESVSVDIGDRVTKGQVLIKLSVPEYRDQLAQKKSLLLQAEAQIKQAEANLKAIEASAQSAQAAVDEASAAMGRVDSEYQRVASERQRIQQLVDKGSMTAKLGDEANSQVRTAEAAKKEVTAAVASAKAKWQEAQAKIATAKADIDAAAARRDVAQADVAQAETMLNYGQLVAPYDGVIVKRHVDQGHFVQPATSPGSTPLLSLASMDKLKVCVDLPEAEAAFVDAGYADANAGDPLTIRSPSMRDQQLQARVTRSSWQLDAENRSLTVESEIEAAKSGLLPGTYVNVSILLEQRDDVLTLPIAAIVRNGNETSCKLVIDKKIVTRPIKLGLRVGDEVQILEGLTGTETVVQARAATLQDGQEVEVLTKK